GRTLEPAEAVCAGSCQDRQPAPDASPDYRQSWVRRSVVNASTLAPVANGDERIMAKMARLGELEQAVMDHLWSAPDPQTVRQGVTALCVRRGLAYTTAMTVLQRLAKKNLVVQHRDDRAPRYAPTHGRDE